MHTGTPLYQILIVDDTTNNIKIAAKMLQQPGYKLFFATSGQEALEAVRQTGFDLILLDVMMPGMDGFEVCQRLKAEKRSADIPVIFLTAKTDTASIVKGFDLGAVDYVTKPFNGKELLARVKTHLALRQAQRRLEEVNSAKDTFFSILAHDLRSPFTTLLGLTEAVEERLETCSREELKRSISRIHQSASRLFALLENLLTWSRLQRGLIECVAGSVSLNLLGRRAVSLFQATADQKQVTLQNRIPEDAVCYADMKMVDTIFRNLVSNAVKFTGAGGTIELSAYVQGHRIAVSVSDTGIGISSNGLNKLFRIDDHYTREGTCGEHGTGLGLSLCKQLAELNGGALHVSSGVNEGSTFTFMLPLHAEPRDTLHGA